jgi:hypothetical protein
MLDAVHHFIHDNKKDSTPHNTAPFPNTLVPRHILLNDAAAAQSRMGWRNFMKGRLSSRWEKIMQKTMTRETSKMCEIAILLSLRNHADRLWTTINDESHKDETRAVAQFKQQALGIHIPYAYSRTLADTAPHNSL